MRLGAIRICVGTLKVSGGAYTYISQVRAASTALVRAKGESLIQKCVKCIRSATFLCKNISTGVKNGLMELVVFFKCNFFYRGHGQGQKMRKKQKQSYFTLRAPQAPNGSEIVRCRATYQKAKSRRILGHKKN